MSGHFSTSCGKLRKRRMAIPFSEPMYERREKRERRERRPSQAVSTQINTQAVFSDLSLKSQVIYLAMLETWRVLKEITQEEAEVVYQEDRKDNTENKEGVSSSGFLMEDIMSQLEDIEKTDNVEKLKTQMGGYEMKQARDDNNAGASPALPDLICSHTEVLTGSENKHKSSALKVLPDLVACSQATGEGEQSRQTSHVTTHHIDLDCRRDSEAERRPNCGDGARVAGTLSQEKDDLCKAFNRCVTTNGPDLMIPGSIGHQSKSSWTQTGRRLVMIAGQARQERISHSFRKPYRGQQGEDAVDDDHHNDVLSSDKRSRSNSPEPYSGLLSTLVLCGVVYLVKEIVI